MTGGMPTSGRQLFGRLAGATFQPLPKSLDGNDHSSTKASDRRPSACLHFLKEQGSANPSEACCFGHRNPDSLYVLSRIHTVPHDVMGPNVRRDAAKREGTNSARIHTLSRQGTDSVPIHVW